MKKVPAEYQALLIVSFGGPEGPDDVIPFLENVLRGRNVPRERMLEVAEHYRHFGGISPINAQNRQLVSALQQEFRTHGIDLPVYFGNRNWHPLLEDTLREMQADGVETALAFFTSTFSCYSGCRQYRENIFEAQQRIGEGAPTVHKLRMCFNHPQFIEAAADRVREAFRQLPASDADDIEVLFTAHSIPQAMADNCNYQLQLAETCRLVAEQAGNEHWQLVFQSRSGPPGQPWLEPDVCDHLESVKQKGTSNVVIMPIGFVSDHMEVMFDLDIEAKEKCEALGINMVRAGSVGVHPKFVSMIRDLVLERMQGIPPAAIGKLPASHDVCPTNCCMSGRPGAVSPV